MADNRKKGETGERLAAERLLASGYQILTTNFRCRGGEIDIVAEKSGTVVFIEVKYRTGLRFGWPAEAVTATKQRRIRAAAEYYIYKNRLTGMDFRFDVVQILDGAERVFEHIENAF